jgi:serine/threonine protein kinase
VADHAPPTDGRAAPTTAFVPTYQQMLRPAPAPAHELSAVGQVIGDFELLQVLGEGSFGKVFLARQLSLNRQVALKVTANRGSEARTLASLEHDHIVQVFTETVDPARDLRLLCMQYVPGTTLERIIQALGERDRKEWSGQAILDALDRLNRHPTLFHPAALRDRELLAQADFVQAACWIGARLAEALDYAHTRGVLHRDIKPANILVNAYGRPFLADFNLAFDTHRLAGLGPDLFGGTLAYMAPEHLDAFNPDDPTTRDAVDRRSDIYSLGVVLYELLTGRRPFDQPPDGAGLTTVLRVLAQGRRAGAPSPRAACPDVPAALDRVVRRCLAPDPAQRYQTGADLARALDGCRELRRIERELPPARRLTRLALRRPFLVLIALMLLPHLLGSLVNISYNALRIVGELGPAQQATFNVLVLGYNLVVYPLCLWVVCRLIAPAVWTWRALERGETVDAERLAAIRRQMVRWPVYAVSVSIAGWLPGGVLFPLGIHLCAGPLGADVFGHFLISFTLSGLIALTYTFFAVQYVVLRVLYPRFWLDAPDAAATELRSVGPRLRLFQLLAGSIPLIGAVLLVTVGLDLHSSRTFQVLVLALIFLGMAGFALALLANSFLGQTLAVLTGTDHPHRGR